jgi:4-aminobutyrate aminotransferase-like enzyme
MEELRALPIVGDVRGEGFFRAAELVGPEGERLDAATREGCLRGYLPGRMLDAGLIARRTTAGTPWCRSRPRCQRPWCARRDHGQAG